MDHQVNSEQTAEHSSNNSMRDESFFRMRSLDFDALSVEDKAERLFKGTEILAPMVRASTTPLRTLAIKYGADTVYSEEIMDRSIVKTTRVLNHRLGTIDYVRVKEHFSAKQLRKMRCDTSNPSLENDNLNLPAILRIDPQIERDRFVYQMGTGEPNLALDAALKVQQDVCGIDINMGCPKKFSVSGGMGSALLQDTTRACEIIRTLRQNIPSLPISAKIRLLPTSQQTIDFVKALQEAGVSAIAVHARRPGDEPSMTLALWDQLQAVISNISVPTIINGDLYTRDDINRVQQECGADSIMLARPALFNTSMFGNISEKVGASPSSTWRLPKHVVIQDYLKESLRYENNYQNVKYVVCEMISQRRTPIPRLGSLSYNFDPPFQHNNIGQVCEQKTMVDLCAVWGVNPNIVPERSIVATPVITSPSSATVKSTSLSSTEAGTEQRYDDRYFLDPEGLRRDREAEEGDAQQKQTSKRPNEHEAGSDIGVDSVTKPADCSKRIKAS
jgi:tRNA-dihydrouridine synthase 2